MIVQIEYDDAVEIICDPELTSDQLVFLLQQCIDLLEDNECQELVH